VRERAGCRELFGPARRNGVELRVANEPGLPVRPARLVGQGVDRVRLGGGSGRRPHRDHAGGEHCNSEQPAACVDRHRFLVLCRPTDNATRQVRTIGGFPATNDRARDAAAPDHGTMTTTAPAAQLAPDATARSSWLGVTSLGFGTFSLVTAEFLPASLLSPIARDLAVTEGLAGQSVTITAIMGAITGLTIAALLPRLDRRHLMIGLMALSIVSNLLVAIAPNIVVLLGARVLLGIAVAGFWTMALAVAAQLVPFVRLGRAMTVVNTGVSLATVAAVPLGTWLGEQWGWRWVFVFAAGLGVLALIAQSAWLPSIAPSGTSGFRALFDTAKSRIILLGLLALLLIPGGHFLAFTYIRPAAEAVAHLDASGLAILLAIYGAASFLGNLASGPLADRRLRFTVVFFPVLLGLSAVAFLASSGTMALTIIAVALWGFGFGGVPTLVQTWFARAEPERLETVGGLVVTMFQVAIATGAAVGGLLVDTVDVRATLVVGGLAAIAGGALLGTIRLRGR
jgi:DHA1 family purine ribonucleoside efflux pump-like MFS transporter